MFDTNYIWFRTVLLGGDIVLPSQRSTHCYKHRLGSNQGLIKNVLNASCLYLMLVHVWTYSVQGCGSGISVHTDQNPSKSFFFFFYNLDH